MAASNKANLALAAKARAMFVEQAAKGLSELPAPLKERFLALMDQSGTGREMQERRDAWFAFGRSEAAWIGATIDAWKQALTPPDSAPAVMNSDSLELIDNEVVENKILASRLAIRLAELSGNELTHLRQRLEVLEGVEELIPQDIVLPEALAKHMVEQWIAASLTREIWAMVQDLLALHFGKQVVQAHRATNEFLIAQGVMPEIKDRRAVKRSKSAGPTSVSQPFDDEAASDSRSDARTMGRTGGGSSGSASRGGASGGSRGGVGAGSGGGGSGAAGGVYNSGASSFSGASSGQQPAGRGGDREPRASSYGVEQTQFIDTGADAADSVYMRQQAAFAREAAHNETRMQTATTPMARVRMRAQGVLGNLKRLLSEVSDTNPQPLSPQLAQALDRAQSQPLDVGIGQPHADETVRGILDGSPSQIYAQSDVEQAAGFLRQRTAALKEAAGTQSEKATIEIVALMFQSILAEERILPTIRVWFARLQMPVLRVAIAEPEFFDSLQHPARRLIDRMGSCVLGFDATIGGGALETEIKRIVQVIEQYPEVGRRAFALVYDEFEKFLSKFLSEQGMTARVVSVAQQIEQKETMVVSYTIEMRKILEGMPVRDEIREFVNKVWVEVLAIAAMQQGPQHEDTLALKQVVADLISSVSAKTSRQERAQVMADFPKQLQLLRKGMTMLGLDAAKQDQHIKLMGEILADAFMAKTEMISPEKIAEMAKRLANLEDYLSDEDLGDLPLDTEGLVTMIGLDSANVNLSIITDGGSQPNDAMRAWAQELQLGTWFSLDHNSQVCDVQLAWRSDKKQLQLFAAADGRTFLIQTRRMAAYLQAGLLVPTEEEALTVRATREALAKLQANPERLLN